MLRELLFNNRSIRSFDPTVKITKEEIISAALELLRRGSGKKITICEKGAAIENRRCPKAKTQKLKSKFSSPTLKRDRKSDIPFSMPKATLLRKKFPTMTKKNSKSKTFTDGTAAKTPIFIPQKQNFLMAKPFSIIFPKDSAAEPLKSTPKTDLF